MTSKPNSTGCSHPERAILKFFYRGEVRIFLLFFLILGGLVALGFGFLYIAEFRGYQSQVVEEQSTGLKIQEELLLLRISEVLSDLDFLTQTICLSGVKDTGDYSNLEEIFRHFGESKKRYDQLRYISADGMEIVRVDTDASGAVVVPQEELQDKSDRYYFIESLDLDEGDVYVSPLDLNVEQGKIEIPLKPMIRFSAPVFNCGEARGFVVINYSAGFLLDEMRARADRDGSDLYLINRDGYYLISPDRQKEWGFMYDEGKDWRFDLDYPEFWEEVSLDDGNIVEDEQGMMIYRRIYPMPAMVDDDKDCFWIAAIPVHNDMIRAEVADLKKRLILLGSFVFLLTSIPAWGLSLLFSRRIRRRKELLLAAKFDNLTRLPNRVLGLDRLGQCLSLSRRYQWQGALFFLDLDGFKRVNDTYGHDAGDALLMEVGRRLSRATRDSDTIARYGGDEFFVVVPREDKDPACLAVKIIEVIEQPYQIQGGEVNISVSIGIRVISGDETETPDSLIRDADQAMYRAKTAGKARYVMFDPDLDTE